MHLYGLTLQRATAITSAIYGSFSAERQHEVVVARGKLLELLRPDAQGKLQSVHTAEVFGIVRSLQAFRLLGTHRDYVVVGSDSGRITVLQYSPETQSFVRVHCETLGKSGCRRIVPGELLAADPRGRAVMIGALEKQKLVYTLNRDSSNNLTISSPLEAHKSHTLCFALCGIDVGFDNPIFAALEVDYEEGPSANAGGSAADGADADEEHADYTKRLTYYEFDLGLNHVTRKWSEPVAATANLLVPVPGGNDGPGGVLVCSEDFVTHRAPGRPKVRCLLPRRRDMHEDHRLLVISSAVHRQRDLFFVLLQTEPGDLIKVTLTYEGEAVSDLTCRYLDTIPPAAALVILRTGFLFSASEAGNHAYYQFQGVGDDDDSPSASASQGPEAPPALIELRPLRNLLLVDEAESLAPVTQLFAGDLARDGETELAALCGRGPRSTLRVLRHGLAVAEMAVSELPGTPNGVWTTRTAAANEFHEFIVVSFVNATLVLRIGDTVEEVTDSGLVADVATLAVQLMDGDGLLQVHAGGLRHLAAKGSQLNWKPNEGQQVVKAVANSRQVALALSGGEVHYFELDAMNVLAHLDKKELGQEVACMDIGSVPPTRQRSRFLVVGAWDNFVRVLSLDQDECMQVIAIQKLPHPMESVGLLDSADAGLQAGSIILAVGLANGVLWRTTMDAQSGALRADVTSVLCGTRGVHLCKTDMAGRRSLLALSSKPWAVYGHMGRLHLTPLSYQALDRASSFCSEQCPEGVVAVSGNMLCIFAPERLGETFNQAVVPLRYTPRRAVQHPPSGLIVVVESDHHAYGEDLKARVYQEADVDASKLLPADQDPPEEEEDGDEGDTLPLMEAMVGVPRAPDGCWAGCVRVVDPAARATRCVVELPQNEAAFSVAAVAFRDGQGEYSIVVGSARDLRLHPRACAGGLLRVYRVLDGGSRLELRHETSVEDVPYALAGFHGRLLVGVGRTLRMYELGKSRLLRRAELRDLPVMVQSIHVLSHDRLAVGDLAESFLWVKYRSQENALHVFADDTAPRWLTAACPLDANTMCGADKFGNVFVCRLPPEAGAELDDVSAPAKAEEIAQYHVGEIVVSLQKTQLSAAGREVVLYATNMGGVGALLPVRSRDDIDLLKHLEMHLRQEAPPLCGRDHMFYRSSFFPVKDVTDGDLCEQYGALPHTVQGSIAGELDMTPNEVSRKLEEMRLSIL